VRLWRYATTVDPYFGHRSYWALDRESAESFARWNAQPEVQQHLDAESGAGERRLYATDIRLDSTVLDLREVSLGMDFTPQEIEARIPKLLESGIRWVLWFELPWEGHRWAQAIYIGDTPVRAFEVDE
jgi:hypothetical protein